METQTEQRKQVESLRNEVARLRVGTANNKFVPEQPNPDLNADPNVD